MSTRESAGNSEDVIGTSVMPWENARPGARLGRTGLPLRDCVLGSRPAAVSPRSCSRPSRPLVCLLTAHENLCWLWSRRLGTELVAAQGWENVQTGLTAVPAS